MVLWLHLTPSAHPITCPPPCPAPGSSPAAISLFFAVQSLLRLASLFSPCFICPSPFPYVHLFYFLNSAEEITWYSSFSDGLRLAEQFHPSHCKWEGVVLFDGWVSGLRSQICFLPCSPASLSTHLTAMHSSFLASGKKDMGLLLSSIHRTPHPFPPPSADYEVLAGSFPPCTCLTPAAVSSPTIPLGCPFSELSRDLFLASSNLTCPALALDFLSRALPTPPPPRASVSGVPGLVHGSSSFNFINSRVQFSFKVAHTLAFPFPWTP